MHEQSHARCLAILHTKNYQWRVHWLGRVVWGCGCLASAGNGCRGGTGNHLHMYLVGVIHSCFSAPRKASQTCSPQQREILVLTRSGEVSKVRHLAALGEKEKQGCTGGMGTDGWPGMPGGPRGKAFLPRSKASSFFFFSNRKDSAKTDDHSRSVRLYERRITGEGVLMCEIPCLFDSIHFHPTSRFCYWMAFAARFYFLPTARTMSLRLIPCFSPRGPYLQPPRVPSKKLGRAAVLARPCTAPDLEPVEQWGGDLCLKAM